MKYFLLLLAEKIILYFINEREVKEFVISLLERYAKSTDNDVDDILIRIVRSKLLK